MKQGMLSVLLMLLSLVLATSASPQDGAEPVAALQLRAEQGDVTAQYELGVTYIRGQGIKRDPDQAEHWLRKAAEGKHREAQFYLALLHDSVHGSDLGLMPDDRQAARWYRLAAEQGHMAASYQLASMYLKGRGVRESLGESMLWFHRAAEGRFGPARQQLALMYAVGRGVHPNQAQAISFYHYEHEEQDLFVSAGVMWTLSLARRARDRLPDADQEIMRRPAVESDVFAEQMERIVGQAKANLEEMMPVLMDELHTEAEEGNPESTYLLALDYQTGFSAGRDPEAALHWMRKAAELGEQRAQLFLGRSLAAGLYGEREDAQAVRWLEAAVAQEPSDEMGTFQSKFIREDIRIAHNLIAFMYASGRGVAQDLGEAVRWYARAFQAGDRHALESLAILLPLLPELHVNSKRLPVRAEASSDHGPVGHLVFDERIYVLATEGAWARVYREEGHLVGWVPVSGLVVRDTAI